MKNFFSKILDYELKTEVGADPQNTAINMAVIVFFVVLGYWLIKKL
jgi:hypothetical protein